MPQGIARVYNRHNYDAEKRRAQETWSNRLETLINQDLITSNVVPFLETG